MKSVVRNLTGSTIVLPRSFNSFPLPANADQDFLYSGISTTDLNKLVSLAKAGSISFPGSTGLGIPAGLQVTPQLTYVLNAQEPADPLAGTTVFSITDSANRTYNGNMWVSTNRAFWTRRGDIQQPTQLGRPFVVLPNGMIVTAGGSEGLDPSIDGNPESDSRSGRGMEIYIDGEWFSIGETEDFIPLSTYAPFVSLLNDGRVLICGGHSQRRPGQRNLLAHPNRVESYVFDNDAGTIVQAGDMPVGIASSRTTFNGYTVEPASVNVNSPVLVAGGFKKDVNGVNVESDKAFLFDPVTLTWSAAADMPQPLRNYANVRYKVGSSYRMGFFGGSIAAGVGTAAVAVYDHATDAWNEVGKTIDDMPSIPAEDVGAQNFAGKRTFAGSALINDKIYIVGGIGGSVGQQLSIRRSTIECDPSKASGQQWKVKNNMAQPRVGLVAVVAGDIIAPPSFQTDNGRSFQPRTSCERYLVNSNKWVHTTRMFDQGASPNSSLSRPLNFVGDFAAANGMAVYFSGPTRFFAPSYETLEYTPGTDDPVVSPDGAPTTIPDDLEPLGL